MLPNSHGAGSPPPLVDEQLVLYDDGRAWLVVRRPRTTSPVIGSFVTRPTPEELRVLEAAGPGRVDIQLSSTPIDHELEALAAILERVCSRARETPHASASFSLRATPSEPGHAELALFAVSAGERAVEFELNPSAGAIHFGAGGQPLSWSELPEIHVGFVTATAKSLGGLRTAAVIEPGAYGVIAVPIAVPDGADAVAFQVAGTLRAALPDEGMPEPFEARTDPVAFTG